MSNMSSVLKDVTTVSQFPWQGVNALKDGRGAKCDLHFQLGTFTGDGCTPVVQLAMNGNLAQTAFAITGPAIDALKGLLVAAEAAHKAAETKRAEIRKAQEKKLAAKSAEVKAENLAQATPKSAKPGTLVAIMATYADLPEQARAAVPAHVFPVVYGEYMTMAPDQRAKLPLASFTLAAAPFLAQVS